MSHAATQDTKNNAPQHKAKEDDTTENREHETRSNRTSTTPIAATTCATRP